MPRKIPLTHEEEIAEFTSDSLRPKRNVTKYYKKRPRTKRRSPSVEDWMASPPPRRPRKRPDAAYYEELTRYTRSLRAMSVQDAAPNAVADVIPDVPDPVFNAEDYRDAAPVDGDRFERPGEAEVQWETLPRAPIQPQEALRRDPVQEANTRQHVNWQRSYVNFSIYGYAHYGSGAAGAAARLKASLQAEFEARVRSHLPAQCPQCGAGDCWEPETPLEQPLQGSSGSTLRYVTVDGSIEVSYPCFKCRHCPSQLPAVRQIHPLEIRCFPSTPDLPAAWYDGSLMQQVCFLRAESPCSTSAFSRMLQRQHSANRLPTPTGITDGITVGTAAAHWDRVQSLMRTSEFLGVDSDPSQQSHGGSR
ncbi:hypothetical protein Vafri_1844 [Volvox africanus]|nr:hypothetical protein Vafri_1844 [Volvox africanus]